MTALTIDRCRKIATGAFLEFADAQPPLASEWTIHNLPEGSDPTRIFDGDPVSIDDISGIPLFFDFFADLDGDEQAVVRVYAMTNFGTPVDSIWKQTAPESYLERFQGLYQRLHNAFGGRVHKNTVCYCYPKLGVMVKDDGQGPSVVYDLFDESQHIVSASEAASPDSDDALAVYSPYQLIPEGADMASLDADFLAKEERYASLVDIMDGAGPSFYKDIEAGEVKEKVLNVPLYGQETSVFCAVAAAQMILSYHGVFKTQNEIAVAMKTGPTGSNNENQVLGYESITNQKFDAKYDKTPQFNEARSEIDSNRPLKSGFPGHARVAIGWRQNPTESWLCINDPWPVNAGSVRWESSASSPWTNWIYVQRIH